MSFPRGAANPGKKFKPGQSGNPNGRPKAPVGLRAELERRYGQDGKLLVERLEELSKARGARNARTALAATELLLAYHSGRATQPFTHSAGDGPPVAFIQVVKHSKDEAK